jgi:hypothetical protein
MTKDIERFLSLVGEFDSYLLMVKTPKGLLGIADGSIVDIAALTMTANARVQRAILALDEQNQGEQTEKPVVFH